MLKVIQAVSQPYRIKGRSVNITISAGVGIYPVHGEDAERLMKSADMAMYEAKRTGKNNYRMAIRIAPVARREVELARPNRTEFHAMHVKRIGRI